LPRRCSCRHLLDLAGGSVARAAGGVQEHVVERHVVAAQPLAQRRLQRRRRPLADDPPAVDDREAVAERVGLL
jgi:hypothetical protein